VTGRSHRESSKVDSLLASHLLLEDARDVAGAVEEADDLDAVVLGTVED
jgi:hypothetical protein